MILSGFLSITRLSLVMVACIVGHADGNRKLSVLEQKTEVESYRQGDYSSTGCMLSEVLRRLVNLVLRDRDRCQVRYRDREDAGMCLDVLRRQESLCCYARSRWPRA